MKKQQAKKVGLERCKRQVYVPRSLVSERPCLAVHRSNANIYTAY